MPIVVKTTQSVDPNAVRPAFNSGRGASPEAFGAANARALQGLGGAVRQAGADLRDIAQANQLIENEAESKRLDTERAERDRILLWGDGTANNPGYFSLQGEDAIKGQRGIVEAIQRNHNDTANSASNSAVRSALVASSNINRLATRVAEHVHNKRIEYGIDAAKARLGSLTLDVSRDPDFLEGEDSHFAKAVAETRALAELEGWGDDRIALELRKNSSILVKSAVEAALQRSPAEAKELFLKYQDRVEGAIKDDLMRQVNTQVELTQVQETADEIMAQPEITETEALKLVREKYEGKQETDAVNEIKRRFAERTKANDEAVKEATDTATQAMAQGNMTWAQYKLANPKAALLIEGDKAAFDLVRAHDQALIDQRTFAVSSDGVTFARLLSLPHEQRADVNLEVEKPRLTDSEYHALVAAQNTSRDRVEDRERENKLREDRLRRSAAEKAETRERAALNDRAVFDSGDTAVENALPARMKVTTGLDEKQKAYIETQKRILQDDMSKWITEYRTSHNLENPPIDLIRQQAAKMAIDIRFEEGRDKFRPFGASDEFFAQLPPEDRRDHLEDTFVPRAEIPPWIVSRLIAAKIDMSDDAQVEGLAAAILFQDLERIETFAPGTVDILVPPAERGK